jgi:DNA-binding transcriptional LysR family regulator
MKNEETEANKASMRLKDLLLTSELLAEAVAQENGARERIAQKYEIQKSVITDRVRRMEQFFNVELFTGAQRKTPTEAGKVMAEYGPQLIGVIEHFAEMLREASEQRRSSLEESR